MDVTSYMEEVEKCIDTLKHQVEKEKKDIADSQRHFSKLLSAFSEKVPSNSVISSLFKDEEPDGFVFSKYEEKRKQLSEQRRAEYNAYLEKKDAEMLSKHRHKEEKIVPSKSILDSVNYEQVLAKRKEEEARFRNMNLTDVLDSSKPVLKENNRKDDVKSYNSENVLNIHSSSNNDSLALVNLPGSTVSLEQTMKYPLVEEKKANLLRKEEASLLEERIAKHLEEQRRQMLLEFENELRKNNEIKKEIENLRANSRKSSPQRPKRIDDFPKIGRTGGGGDPVRDSFGNLLTIRARRNESDSDYKNIMSFPSMQQQPFKDRKVLYREELQKQIEEKKRLEAIERTKTQELEEKIAQRIEEQRLQMQQEYEKELEKNNKIKLEFERQQERIRKLEEFQRKDAEARRKKLTESKPPESEKPRNEVVIERSQSPPIPAVRTKVLLEKVAPVTTENTLTEVKPENVFSSLAEIRKKLMQDQQRPKKELNSYEVMNRRTVQDISDDDDDILKTSYS